MDLPYVPSMMSVLATTNIISDVLKHKTMEELNRNSKLNISLSSAYQHGLCCNGCNYYHDSRAIWPSKMSKSFLKDI